MERSPSVENVRHLQLMAVLRDLIDGNGRVKAAKMLGVSYRTLARAADTGRLTGRMTDALERHLLSDVRSPANEWNERAAELDQRVDSMETWLTDVAEAVRSGIEKLRADVGGAHETLHRRLAKLEADRESSPETHAIWTENLPNAVRSKIVVLDPEHDDGQRYGPASPLVEEWRLARSAYRTAEDRLAKPEAEAHLLEIEIVLIESHKLTLPPADYPWDRFDLEDQTRRRKRRLAVVQVEIRKARIRRSLCRIFTLGFKK